MHLYSNPWICLNHVFPLFQADPAGLDLLGRLLTFDPSKRIDGISPFHPDPFKTIFIAQAVLSLF